MATEVGQEGLSREYNNYLLLKQYIGALSVTMLLLLSYLESYNLDAQMCALGPYLQVSELIHCHIFKRSRLNTALDPMDSKQ